MERVQSVFSSAFNTPAGILVEKATSSSLPSEDWALNMQVCDEVNSYGDGAKDAVKAIKKRLSNNKNFNQISLTLSLLESCIKNCGSQFHVFVTTREFSADTLMKLLQPKHNPPVILQQRVLGLIKQLAETFGSNPAMSGVRLVYEELHEKGHEFPKTESLEGIIGRPAAHPTVQPGAPTAHARNSHRSRSSGSQGQLIRPTPEQITKLQKDLAVVNGNIKVFSEMLTELNPLACDSSDYELLQELSRTCRAMQQRVMELIGQVSNEEITVELLRVNDDLNNVFLRYDRFEKYRANKDTGKPVVDDVQSPPPINHLQTSSGASVHSSFPVAHPIVEEPPPSYSDTELPTPEVNDLIDLTETPSSSAVTVEPQQSSNIPSLSKELGDISLNDRLATSATPASYPLLTDQLASFNRPTEEIQNIGASEKELEQWLATEGLDGQRPESGSAPNGNSGAVTDEFSAFLNERASASKHLPDLQPPSK